MSAALRYVVNREHCAAPVTYHCRRRQRRLDKLTPIEYEMLFTETALAACPPTR